MNGPAARTPAGRAARRAQRGVVAVMGALWLLLAVACLMVIDVGYLFWQQREVQRIADLAAMAAASGEEGDCARYALNEALRNGLRDASELRSVECGHWDPRKDATDPAAGAGRPAQFFSAGVAPFNAARVTVERSVNLFFVLGGDASRVLTATATGARSSPLAALRIRSTLLDVDDPAGLNAVLGALLGVGPLDIPVAGWRGLLNTEISVLDYLIALGATAGDYESLLDSRVKLTELLAVAADLMRRNGDAVDAAAALDRLRIAAAVRDADIRVGDLLNVSSGTPLAGLQVGVQAFSLAQGAIQIANGEHAVASELAVNIPGLAGVSSSIKVVEKPRTSSIGDPRLIDTALGAADPNGIQVRTAQIRTLHSVNLTGVASVASQLASAVTGLVSPLINFLESVASLDLGGIVQNLVGTIACGQVLLPSCPVSKVIYTSVLPGASLDVSLEGGGGEAYVSGHGCGPEAKSLDVQASTYLAKVRVGRIQNAFSSHVPVTVDPVSLVEIGYTEQRHQSCLLSLVCTGHQYRNSSGAWVSNATQAHKTVIAGIGVKADIPLLGSQSSPALHYAAPAADHLPNVDDPPYAGTGADPSYQAINATDVVGGLESSLDGIDIAVYQSGAGGVLGGLLNGTAGLLNGLLDTVGDIVGSALHPLLDPSINTVLSFLGIDLATTEVGARLTCRANVELVY